VTGAGSDSFAQMDRNKETRRKKAMPNLTGGMPVAAMACINGSLRNTVSLDDRCLDIVYPLFDVPDPVTVPL
jgi:hypothetical protein